MKKVIFAFLVLLALFAAFIVLASSIRQLLMGESGQKTSQCIGRRAEWYFG